MRVTLEIDDEVLLAARELAADRRKTIGRVVSELARRTLAHESVDGLRNGVPVLPRRQPGSPRPTANLVNALRDSE